VWWGHTNSDWDGDGSNEYGPIPQDQGGTSVNEFVNVSNPSQQPNGCAEYTGICSARVVDNVWGSDRASATTQEFFDMRAGVDVSMSGLIVHSGPTINAAQVATLNWNSPVTVNSRLHFPIYPDYSDPNDSVPNAGQVWYQIQQPSGWILARIVNFEPDATQPAGVIRGTPPEFFYVNDGDPCGNQVTEPTEDLTFVYDRRASAEYAMAHAYRNTVAGLNYPTATSVTTRLNSTIEVDSQPIPYADRVPYARFAYSDVSGQIGATGSAVFSSEAIWVGGLPMTFDVDMQQEIIVQECKDSILYHIGGWRYCDREAGINGQSTKVWSNHQGIVCYYAQAPLDIGFRCAEGDGIETAFDVNNIVIPTNQHGEYIATFDLFDEFGNRREEITEVLPTLRETGGEPVIDNNPSDFYDRFIDPNSNDLEFHIDGIEQIQAGDYVFVERRFDNDNTHGFLVVGWGNIMSCPSALELLWIYETPSQGTNQYAQLYTNFASAPDNVVPYVADFPGSVDSGNQTQRPRPRPFYCADYFDPSTQNYQTVNDGFAFFRFPNSIAIPHQKLYQSESWEWTMTDGQ
jgi:hypothetical protein